MEVNEIKIGMRVYYDRAPGVELPVCCFVRDKVFHHCEILCTWLKPADGGMDFLAPISKLKTEPGSECRIAVILKVNHLEATSEGFEGGDIFGLEYMNKDIFIDIEAVKEFLTPINLIQGYADGCWDYAVYKVEPEGIPINIGPGDQVVIYEDKHFGVYAGVGKLKVIDNTICVGR